MRGRAARHQRRASSKAHDSLGARAHLLVVVLLLILDLLGGSSLRAQRGGVGAGGGAEGVCTWSSLAGEAGARAAAPRALPPVSRTLPLVTALAAGLASSSSSSLSSSSELSSSELSSTGAAFLAAGLAAPFLAAGAGFLAGASSSELSSSELSSSLDSCGVAWGVGAGGTAQRGLSATPSHACAARAALRPLLAHLSARHRPRMPPQHKWRTHAGGEAPRARRMPASPRRRAPRTSGSGKGFFLGSAFFLITSACLAAATAAGFFAALAMAAGWWG